MTDAKPAAGGRIVFRVDASAAIGLGHLRRCLTLAELFRERGHEVLFVCRALADNLNDDVRSAGFALAELGSDDDAAETLAVLGHAPVAAIVVDHYGLDAEWERAMRPLGARMIAIDDLADRPHDIDVLIDVTPGEDHARAYDGLLPEGCLRLTGPGFAMLRPEFRAAPPLRDGTIGRVLVSFGAVDAEDRCGAAYEAVRAALGADVEIDVVLSRIAPHREALEQRAAADAGLKVHVDTPAMAELMRAADVAIGAGGTTSWERARLGLPTLVAAIAANQRESVAALEALGCAIRIDAGAQFAGEIGQALGFLRDRPAIVRLIGEAAARLVDGRGAERVAQAIAPSTPKLRRAEAGDARDLWEWRNAEPVRLASKNKDPIPWEAHEAWFAERLGDPKSAMLIGEERGRPVGVIRFEIDGASAEVSVYLAPGRSGRGHGPALLRAGEDWLRRERPEVERIVAEILPGNRASVAAFEGADYEPRMLKYERKLRG